MVLISLYKNLLIRHSVKVLLKRSNSVLNDFVIRFDTYVYDFVIAITH